MHVVGCKARLQEEVAMELKRQQSRKVRDTNRIDDTSPNLPLSSANLCHMATGNPFWARPRIGRIIHPQGFTPTKRFQSSRSDRNSTFDQEQNVSISTVLNFSFGSKP